MVTREKIRKEMPDFGPLQGLRIIDSGSVIAQPWAATLAAEFGAEVIKLEQPFKDVVRTMVNLPTPSGEKVSTFWLQEHRNKLDMSLDYTKPEAKEIFARIVKTADIWMESSIPGTYSKKFGITDEWCWEQNPKLVIVHVSGFGQSGVPEYVGRASYDMIGQAFGGLCDQIGEPDGPPMRVGPALNDYITALWALWSGLAAYIRVQKTGKGEMVDVAQYEVQFRMLESTAMDYFMLGQVHKRVGNFHPLNIHPYGIYPTKDGFVCIGAAGGPFARVIDAIPELKEAGIAVKDQFTRADDIKRIVMEWLADKTTDEAEKILLSHTVPCTRVMTMEDIAHDPQYQAREDFLEWEDPAVGKVKGAGLMPKFKNEPGQVWRGSPLFNQDVAEILQAVGYSRAEVVSLIERGVVGQPPAAAAAAGN